MPHLKARLGKARTDRVRYAGTGDNRKEKGATNITNTLIQQMQFKQPHDYGCPIADVLYGAANIDSNQAIPLSVNRLYNILQSVETINTREVSKMTGLEKRQAQRYVRAVKFAMPHITGLV